MEKRTLPDVLQFQPHVDGRCAARRGVPLSVLSWLCSLGLCESPLLRGVPLLVLSWLCSLGLLEGPLLVFFLSHRCAKCQQE